MDVTIDDFHSSGVFPMDIKESKIRDNGSAIHAEMFLNKSAGRSSGPLDVLDFIFLIER